MTPRDETQPTRRQPTHGVRSHIGRSACLAVLLLGVTVLAQEEPTTTEAAAPPTTSPDQPPPLPPGDAYRPIGPQLFPLYEHYLRTTDNATVRNFLYLFRMSSRPDGSYSTLLFPAFYREQTAAPRREILSLFPLLIYQGETDTSAFDVFGPLYVGWRDADSGFRTVLPPLWVQTQSDSGQLSRQHVLFPFFRLTHDFRDPRQSAVSSRFGIPGILEFWESRRPETRTDFTGFNFFNWSEETRSGLALYRHSWRQGENRARGSTYLFPLYWHGDDAGSKYLFTLPLFGYASSGRGGSDLYLFPLLSRVGGGPGLEKRVNVLFPLFGYASGPERFSYHVAWPIFRYRNSAGRFSVAAWPLYNYIESNEDPSWFELLGLYSQAHNPTTEKASYAFLWPLVYHSLEPDSSAGNRWFFPYYETFNDVRRWRYLFPLFYIQRQTLAASEVEWHFTYGVPTYISWGYPDDRFGFGLPLYWESHTGRRGWRMMIPNYWDFYSSTSRALFVLPFFIWRDYPSVKQLGLVWPLFSHERFYGLDQRPDGGAVDLPWPLLRIESREDGYHYRFLPLFWVSRDGETRDLLLASLYYQQDGPQGTQRYIAPFYGRYRSERLDRKFYAAGSVVTSEERNLAGDLTSERLDLLWWLASFEENHVANGEHQHFLPVGFWRTRTPPEDRTIAGPFYYGHRIAEQDRMHYLSLFLGNVFFSSVIEGPADISQGAPEPTQNAVEVEVVEAPAAVPTPATGPTAPAQPEFSSHRGRSPLFPLAETDPPPAGSGLDTASTPAQETESLRATATTEEPPLRQEEWRDHGIVWPISRWYRSSTGEHGNWLIPLYFDVKTQFTDTFALFPLYFGQEQSIKYSPTYFRYFFLYDRETWTGGNRKTVGQILFDWLDDEIAQRFRLRLIYPMFEYDKNRDSVSIEFTPAISIEHREEAGERESKYRFFPLYWQGTTERQYTTDGSRDSQEWEPERSHFFLFPLFGVHKRSTRTDYYFLFPLFHLLDSNNSLNFEMWPSLFYRNEPGINALRFWPLYADESGEVAGDFWVSRYLFLSKRFEKSDSIDYRLDPFLFRYYSSPDESSSGALFELIGHHAQGDDWSFRAIPFAFGRRNGLDAFWSVIPFYFSQDFGSRPVDRGLSPRDFLPFNHLYSGDGERYTSYLWRSFTHSSDPNRPLFHERNLLLGLYLDRQTETSRQWRMFPFYSYFRDDTTDETIHQFLYLYEHRVTRGQTKRTLLFFFSF